MCHTGVNRVNVHDLPLLLLRIDFFSKHFIPLPLSSLKFQEPKWTLFSWKIKESAFMKIALARVEGFVIW